MSHHLPIAVSPSANLGELPVHQDKELPPPALPSKDQIQVIDAAFAQDQENRTVAGIMGMYAGAMLLNDLAHEHFDRPEDEIDLEEKKEGDPN